MKFKASWLLSILLVAIIFLTGHLGQQTIQTNQTATPPTTQAVVQTLPKTDSELFLESLENASKIKSAALFYDLESSVQSGGIIMYFVGSDSTYGYNDRSKSITTISTPDKKFTNTTEIYFLPQGRVQCEKSLVKGYSCWEYTSKDPLTDSLIINPVKQKDSIKDWIREGIISIEFLGKDKIFDIECNNFLLDIDLPRLAKNVTESFSFLKENTNYSLVYCLDANGVEIGYDLNLTVKDFPSKGDFNLKLKYKIKDFHFNATEKDVSLPVTVDEVQWLPNFQITSAECLDNKVGLKLKATKKDLSTTTANLNVTYFTYNDIVFRYETKNILDKASFSGLKKGDSTEILFVLSSDLNQITRNQTVYENLYLISLKIDDSESFSYCYV